VHLHIKLTAAMGTAEATTAIPFEELIRGFSPERRAKIDRRAEELPAQVHDLRAASPKATAGKTSKAAGKRSKSRLATRNG
jgi:hypothetical protein